MDTYSIGLDDIGTIYFLSSAIQTQYVKDEYKYTQQEFIEYIKAISPEDRKAAKKVLNLKRAKFAVEQGYERTAQGVWKKVK